MVVTAVKLADDGSGDVVVRFHESRGGHTRATLATAFEFASVTVTDLLERPLAGAGTPEADGRRITLSLRPFELVTLRLRRA